MWRAASLAGLAGLLHVAIYPPHRGSWLAFVALVPLLHSLCSRPQTEGFRWGTLWRGSLVGVCFGVASVVGVVYWIPEALQTGSGFGPRSSRIVAGLVVAHYSFWFAVFGALAASTVPRLSSRLIALPSLWVAMEFARDLVTPALSWIRLGHSQHDSLYFSQIAELAGVKGVSFAVVGINVLVWEMLQAARHGTAASPGWHIASSPFS